MGRFDWLDLASFRPFEPAVVPPVGTDLSFFLEVMFPSLLFFSNLKIWIFCFSPRSAPTQTSCSIFHRSCRSAFCHHPIASAVSSPQTP